MISDQANDKRSPIIGGALILTVGFLALFVALLSAGKFPDGCTSGLWLIDRLSCLEPNALGDTFAGAFAPVAFVWLVAAVMLQRNELAAQRQELREAREVAVQQVEEARKNVGLLSAQTAMLEEDRKAKAEHEADQDIIELAATAVAVFKYFAENFTIAWNPEEESPETRPFSFGLGDVTSDLEGLGAVRDKIQELYIDISVHNMEDGGKFQYGSDYLFERLEALFLLIDKNFALTSVPMQAELARLGLTALTEKLNDLKEALQTYGYDPIPF